MAVALQSLQSSARRGLNLSLLKVGPIVQVSVGAIVTALVLIATATTFTVVITRSQYTPPSPVNDEFTITKADTPLLDVLANDVDEREPDRLFISAVTQPLFGKVSITKDKKRIVYQPAPRYAGDVEFEYTCSNSKLSAKAKVLIHITNHAPEAVDHNVLVSKNSVDNKFNVIREVNKNGLKCSDVDPGEVLTVKGITQPPKHGSAKFDDEHIYYTPDKDSMEDDELEYMITDGNDTAIAKVYYKIKNDPPIARPDFYTIPMNTIGVLDLLENDEDINHDPLKIISVRYRGPNNVLVDEEETEDGNKKQIVKYVPFLGYTGSETFEYTITDGAETSSSFATVVIANTKPEADSFTVRIPKNSVDFEIPDFNSKFRDRDIATTLTVKIIDGPHKGGSYSLTYTQKKESVQFAGDKHEYTVNVYSLKFTPKPDEVYTDTLVYEVSDGRDTTTGTITIDVYNEAPIAKDDFAECPKNKDVFINVIQNDEDPNGDQIRIVSVTPTPGQGSVVKVNDAQVKYTAPNSVGDFTFTYTIEDIQSNPEHNLKSTATVTVHVYNQPPEPKDDAVNAPKGLATTIDVLQNDEDPNGDALTIVGVSKSMTGITPTIVNEDGQKIRYEAKNEIYTDTFTYTVSDGEFTREATVTVHVKNTPPHAVDDETTTHWRIPVEIDVLKNDYDINGDPLSVIYVDSENATNLGDRILYRPAKQKGQQKFNYKISDGADESEAATVTVHVTNTPPTVDDIEVVQLRNTTKRYNVLEHASDSDGDPLYLETITVGPTGRVEIEDNMIKYTAGLNLGPEVIKFIVSDNIDKVEGTLKINVDAVPPIAEDDHFEFFTTDFDGVDGVILNVLANDNDGEFIKIYKVYHSNPSEITIVDGKRLKYSPSVVEPTTITFKYQIEEIGVQSNNATVTVIIKSAPPKLSDQEVEVAWNDEKDIDVKVGASGEIKEFSYSSPFYGDLTEIEFGVFKYKPRITAPLSRNPANGRYEVRDTVIVTAKNSFGETGSATIGVIIWNRKPQVNDDFLEIDKAPSYEERAVYVLHNDHDDEELTIKIVNYDGDKNSFVYKSDDGKYIRYQPQQPFSGQERITYIASDGKLDSDVAVLTVNIRNQPPTCNDVQFNVFKGETKRWDLISIANCVDPNGDHMILKLPANVNQEKGNVAIVDGELSYSPKNHRSGDHEFEFLVDDQDNGVTTNRVKVKIENRRPQCVDATLEIDKNSGQHIIDAASDYCQDLDPTDILKVVNVQPIDCESGGNFAIVNDKIRYTVAEGFSGNCVVRYTVSDGDMDNEETATAIITFKVINHPPIARDDIIKNPQSSNAEILISTLLENDEDPDKDPIKFDGIEWSACELPGYCRLGNNRKDPILSGDKIIVETDTSNCDAYKFMYRIKNVYEDLYDNATVTVEWTSCRCYAPIDVMFVVDGSISINDDNWGILKEFMKGMVDQFELGDQKVRVGAIQFSQYSKVEFNFTHTNVKSNIDKIKRLNKWTGTVKGLETALAVVNATTRSNAKKVIVLITDGVANIPFACGTPGKVFNDPQRNYNFGKDAEDNILTCMTHYGVKNDYIEKCKSPFVPGDCTVCVKDEESPCSDPRKVCAKINEIPGWKVVALGIGPKLTEGDGFGWRQVKACSFKEDKAFHVDWGQLENIVNEIVDVSCNNNS